MALIDGPHCGLCNRYIARRSAPGWSIENPIQDDEWRCAYCSIADVVADSESPREAFRWWVFRDDAVKTQWLASASDRNEALRIRDEINAERASGVRKAEVRYCGGQYHTHWSAQYDDINIDIEPEICFENPFDPYWYSDDDDADWDPYVEEPYDPDTEQH